MRVILIFKLYQLVTANSPRRGRLASSTPRMSFPSNSLRQSQEFRFGIGYNERKTSEPSHLYTHCVLQASWMKGLSKSRHANKPDTHIAYNGRRFNWQYSITTICLLVGADDIVERCHWTNFLNVSPWSSSSSNQFKTSTPPDLQ